MSNEKPFEKVGLFAKKINVYIYNVTHLRYNYSSHDIQ